MDAVSEIRRALLAAEITAALIAMKAKGWPAKPLARS